MTKLPLTAAQVKLLDEIAIDRKAAEDTLNVALSFHSNRMNELNKAQRDFWSEIIEAHGLDENTDWKTASVGGQMVVTENVKD